MRFLRFESALAVLLGVSSLAAAQEAPPAPSTQPLAPQDGGANPARRQDRRQRDVSRAIQQLADRLGLTEEQAAKVKAVIEASVAQAEQIRGETEARNQALEKEREAKIEALLTQEQAEQYRQLRAERDQRRERSRQARAGGAGRPGAGLGGAPGRGGLLGRILGADPEQLAQELGLTEEQRGQIQEAVREVAGSARELLAGARGAGPEGMAQAVGELRRQLQERIGGFLTPEQRTRLPELMAARDRRGGPERPARGDRPERGRRQPAADPGARADRRFEGLLRGLTLSEDEQLVLEPKIREILTLDADTGATAQMEREALEALVRAEGDVDPEALRARMAALRQIRESQSTQRTKLEGELRELVTLKQEAVLFLHRVLR